MFWLYWLLGILISVFATAIVIKRNRELGYTILVVVLAGFILISNIFTPRLININVGNYNLSVVTGSLLWPFVAQITDMINEIYGKRKTIFAFGLGYLINLLFVIFVLMANTTVPVWNNEMESFWETYFMPSGRVFLASTVSFVICQMLDAYVFSFLKEKYRKIEDGGSFKAIIYFSSIRSCASDFINMLCDGIVFTVIAFVFTVPVETLLTIALSSVIIKVFMALIDTPLFAVFRLMLRNEKRNI